MADTTYSVELKDDVSPGLDNISKAYSKLDKQFEKGFKTNSFDKVTEKANRTATAVNKVAKTTEKATNSNAKTQSSALQKIDKTLGMFSQPIGKMAGAFGPIGDAVEGVTGKMIQMGGKAGVLGAVLLGTAAIAAVVAGALYGITKAALFADEQTAKYNKTLMFIKGSLGNYQSQADAVIKQSMVLSKAIGEPYDALAPIISKAVAKGADLNTATDFATLKSGMEKYGEAGKEVTDVLDQLVSGTKFTKTSKDINKVQDALDRVGVKNIKAIDIIKEKDAKKQLAMITSNKLGIKNLKKELNESVPATTKLKNAWEIMLAKVFGGQGKNPINDAIEKIMKWMDNPSNIKKIQDFFGKMSEAAGKIDVSSVLNAITAIMHAIEKTVEAFKELNRLMNKGTTENSSIDVGLAAARKARIPISAPGITATDKGLAPTTNKVVSPPSLKGFRRSLTTGATSSIAGETPNYEAVKDTVSNTNTTNVKNENKFAINITPTKDMNSQDLAITLRKELDKYFKDQTVVAGA